MQIKNFVLVSALLITGTISCKKNDPNPNAEINSEAWEYAKDIYLWNTQLPSGFNPSGYSDPNAVMEAIRKYSNEPGFSDPVDRWSFGIKKSEWDDLSSGISGDLGLNIFFRSDNDLRVSYVEPASPAGAAGIQRGWRIISINNNSSISSDDASINRIVNAIFSSASATIGFKRPDNTETTITLTAATYQEQPVYLDSIYTVAGKKAGYLVYNSFLGKPDDIKSIFSAVFSKFSNQAINDLIVDLRYNGGGYVELQNELANYLVPASGNNGVMLKEEFNDNYKSHFDTTIHYSKKGDLNLDRIFFITTKNTASASELLINSLKPYMDVKQVGRASHGKAVGYFEIPVGDWYVFPVSFRTVNKNEEGNYFNGLQPDAIVNDGLDKDWGDVNEDCLASALHYIGYGSFSNIAGRRQEDIQTENKNNIFSRRLFKGTVEKTRRNPR
ncbi:MAG: hypothetical protein KF862_07925 [Chitinophagaceae bacterium]|nr:hypothetical protein [Chitinophagaceae bacterium]